MCIELAVHKEYVVSQILSRLDGGVLIFRIGGVEEYEFAVFVFLALLYGFTVLFDAVVLAFGVLKKGEFHSALAELLVGKHTILYE